MSHDDTATNPLEKFQRWYSEAQGGSEEGGFMRSLVATGYGFLRRTIPLVSRSANLFRPDVATLATVSADDKPSARSVLFRGIFEGGFCFYTDYESGKGRELALNPAAVMLFYWSLPPRQVRIDGRVKKLSREHAEADWKTRTRPNQAAAAAVTQSRVISGREELVEKTRQIEEAYRDEPIPCPKSWGGYCLVPESIEFWQGSFDWLHDRERYVSSGGGWRRVQLAP